LISPPIRADSSIEFGPLVSDGSSWSRFFEKSREFLPVLRTEQLGACSPLPQCKRAKRFLDKFVFYGRVSVLFLSTHFLHP